MDVIVIYLRRIENYKKRLGYRYRLIIKMKLSPITDHEGLQGMWMQSSIYS